MTRTRRDSLAQLIKDIERGVAYFWAQRIGGPSTVRRRRVKKKKPN
jgi:hypothetical protein